MSSQPLMVNLKQVPRRLLFAFLLSLLFMASGPPVHAQSFTLTILSQLSPAGVDPGGVAIATLGVTGTASSVSFSSTPCAVTPVQTAGTPTCSVSPDPATPSANVFVTVATTSSTPPGRYIVTVTGTSGATSLAAVLSLTVEPVTQDYTLSVSPTTATPNPTPAGSTATATVTVTALAGYTGNVTLSCLSVSPVVTPSPYCSFNPPTVSVTAGGAPLPSTLTIITSGPTPVVRLWNQRVFYAFWLAVPGLALVGVGGANGTRKKRLLGILFLTAIGSSVLLLPSCSSSSTDNNGVTPTNTYTFTLTGTDANGAGPSSATATTVAVAVN